MQTSGWPYTGQYFGQRCRVRLLSNVNKEKQMVKSGSNRYFAMAISHVCIQTFLTNFTSKYCHSNTADILSLFQLVPHKY